MVEVGNICYVRKVVFEGMSNRVVSGLRQVFKSQIGGNAVLNNWVIYFKWKSWGMMEASKSAGRELGSRVCSGRIFERARIKFIISCIGLNVARETRVSILTLGWGRRW